MSSAAGAAPGERDWDRPEAGVRMGRPAYDIIFGRGDGSDSEGAPGATRQAGAAGRADLGLDREMCFIHKIVSSQSSWFVSRINN